MCWVFTSPPHFNEFWFLHRLHHHPFSSSHSKGCKEWRRLRKVFMLSEICEQIFEIRYGNSLNSLRHSPFHLIRKLYITFTCTNYIYDHRFQHSEFFPFHLRNSAFWIWINRFFKSISFPSCLIFIKNPFNSSSIWSSLTLSTHWSTSVWWIMQSSTQPTTRECKSGRVSQVTLQHAVAIFLHWRNSRHKKRKLLQNVLVASQIRRCA